MNQQADSVTDEEYLRSLANPNSRAAGGEEHGPWAVGLTAAILAFVGAVVVLSIPYAVLSVPLPASVDRLGVSGSMPAGWLFGRPEYLLIPAGLAALGVGYGVYRRSRGARSGSTVRKER